MAVSTLFQTPNLDALAIEYIELEHRSTELRRRYERLTDRLGLFPNVQAAAEQDALATELDALVVRMREINAALLPLRRHG